LKSSQKRCRKESNETRNARYIKDEDLRAVIGRAGELLRQHGRERKEKALEDARSILEAAGLSLGDVAAESRNIPART
jgi:hypothetical protein